MADIAAKWKNTTESIFSTMTREAQRMNAINLAQGFPDFDGPLAIKEAACAAIHEGKNQYAPAPGILPLRQVLAKLYGEKLRFAIDADTETTIFSGATEAIFCSVLGLCEPGDEVITFEPFYDSYPAAIMAAGATCIPVPLVGPSWTFSEETLVKALTPRTKAILLNTPHNPTGKVFSFAELEVIAKIAQERDIFVISDEVYDQIYFGDTPPESIAAFPGMRERTVTISSTSKSFSMTGWKIGYTFAPPRLTAALRTVHQFTVFCSATPLQWGMLAAFSLDLAPYFAQLRAEYRQRRDFLHQTLLNAGFVCHKPEGAYFITAGLAGLSPKNDRDFCFWLTEHVGVSAIPVSAFCTATSESTQNARYVRFGFCKKIETLIAAAQRLEKLKDLLPERG